MLARTIHLLLAASIGSVIAIHVGEKAANEITANFEKVSRVIEKAGGR